MSVGGDAFGDDTPSDSCVSLYEPGQVHGSFRVTGFSIRVILLKADVNEISRSSISRTMMMIDRLLTKRYISNLKPQYLMVEERPLHSSFARNEALVRCNIRKHTMA
jgi:hypothetical protein